MEGGPVDYSKIDAALASALNTEGGGQETYVVFIHTTQPPGPAESALLAKHGVSIGSGKILTASLSRPAIEEMSEQPWVRALRLSTKLRPLQHT
jgi:hypothetical protein